VIEPIVRLRLRQPQADGAASRAESTAWGRFA
jgi:hypothetical protein